MQNSPNNIGGHLFAVLRSWKIFRNQDFPAAHTTYTCHHLTKQGKIFQYSSSPSGCIYILDHPNLNFPNLEYLWVCSHAGKGRVIFLGASPYQKGQESTLLYKIIWHARVDLGGGLWESLLWFFANLRMTKITLPQGSPYFKRLHFFYKNTSLKILPKLKNKLKTSWG